MFGSNKSVHSWVPQWLDPCSTIKATTSNQGYVSSGCLIMFQMALKKGLHRKVTMSSRHFLSINIGVTTSIQAFFLLGVTFRLVQFQSSKLNMPHISINIHKSGRNPYIFGQTKVVKPFFCLESIVFNLAGTLSTAMLSMRTKPSKGPGKLGELLYSLYGVFMEHKTILYPLVN